MEATGKGAYQMEPFGNWSLRGGVGSRGGKSEQVWKSVVVMMVEVGYEISGRCFDRTGVGRKGRFIRGSFCPWLREHMPQQRLRLFAQTYVRQNRWGVWV